MSLTEFLVVRIAEDEHEAGDPGWCDCAVEGLPLQHGTRCPVRLLAECEAKRQIVGLHRDGTPLDMIAEYIEDDDEWTPWCLECAGFGDYKVEIPCPTLRVLTLPYADHPDYDPAWRP